jgi:hypothetical protein
VKNEWEETENQREKVADGQINKHSIEEIDQFVYNNFHYQWTIFEFFLINRLPLQLQNG